jgi:hypothetical protein
MLLESLNKGVAKVELGADPAKEKLVGEANGSGAMEKLAA